VERETFCGLALHMDSLQKVRDDACSRWVFWGGPFVAPECVLYI
jgi:hypothetical protein